MASLTKNEKALDKIFSKWVRYSRAKNGYCVCVSCEKMEPPEDMDAGHYLSREHKATRWNEMNCWPQCRSCNRFKEGRKDGYALFLEKKYGHGILQELEKQKWTPVKIDDLQIMAMVHEYKQKLHDLP